MEFLQKSVVPAIMKFVNTKGVTAIKNGMVQCIPVIITGSIFLILAQLPIESLANVIAESGLQAIFFKAYNATFSIDAIVAVLGIGYEYAMAEKVEPFGSAVIAMCAFLLLQPDTIAVTADLSGNEIEAVASGINRTWTAGQGMIGSIIIGLISGFVYSWFIKNNIKITMPAGVPEGVSNSFSALIPCIAIIAGATVIHGICYYAADSTFMELFYDAVAAPLQNVTDSVGGVVFYSFMATFLWMFGVHGASVMGGIMGGIFQANQLENQAIFSEVGLENWSVNTPGVHIVTQQFIDLFQAITGSGITFGIVIYTLFFAKSAQLKALAKVEVVPALFNINEPFLFGVPICLNPFMAVPFILTPMIAVILEYIAISVGFIAPYTGVSVPWTTPPVISGFIVGASGGTAIQTALLQLIVLVISTVIYFPFMKSIDNQNLAAEKAAAEAGDDDDDW